MTHKLTKCALAVIINKVIRKTNNVDKMLKELVKFALYLNRTMPPYLNTTKDNVVTYYNQFVKNKLSTIR